MKARLLESKDIKAHGPHPSDYGGVFTVFELASKMHLGKQFQTDLRQKIWDAEDYCCFGATNNPGVLRSCFNKLLKETGRI